ncbi:MAG: phosphoribosylformylglycinamidine cyclo-ligase [Bdellovibrionaceae bacterium]|jgi:phosphoribosylformylglycinamidine cyclo-ligase|nr:phosphoribosylformylglycinamidine cyclo-ligase [Pseudobdellovibrionaceae bacterium]
MSELYKQSGVDIDKADRWVDRLGTWVTSTYNASVKSGVGGFASLYETQPGYYLASSTDGVGTKLYWAVECRQHRGIGQDLVAMCVNDLICVGARPLFFLDYLAVGRLDEARDAELLQGMIEACQKTGMALVGGETAEMPGLYGEKHYDLAGFAVGEVRDPDLLGGAKVRPGASLLGLASSGFHSNGFSLLRRLLEDHRSSLSDLDVTKFMRSALTPTSLYVSAIQEFRKNYPHVLQGLSHITGSGVENIPRMNEDLLYYIDFWPSWDELASPYQVWRGLLPLERGYELYRVFNMGIGMVLAWDEKNLSLAEIQGFFSRLGIKTWKIGQVLEAKDETQRGTVSLTFLG